MMRKMIRNRKNRNLFEIAVLTGALVLSGCGPSGPDAGNAKTAGSSAANAALTKAGVITAMDVSDMFSNRDKEVGYDESQCTVITFHGDSASSSGKSVKIEGSTVMIQEKGSYLLRGTLKNGSVRVDAPKEDKVQIILDGVEISCEGTAPLYCKRADKVFLTLAAGSKNQLSNTGEFQSIDDNKIDGAIFSKCDLTLNGTGSLVVNSQTGHGIVGKDDLVITSGSYQITSGDHGISGKDSVRIADGEITITCKEDGLHSGNDEDEDKGFVYIEGGKLTISAGDDGIHGESKTMICGGSIEILQSYEGIEAAVVEIAGGEILINAKDDGINAADGSGDGFGDFGKFSDFGDFSGFEGFGNFEGFEGFGDFGDFGSFEGFGDAEGFGNFENFGKFPDKGNLPEQPPGGQMTSASNNFLLISGGRITVNASGDGLDANGDFKMTGGEVFISGPESAANGALDYDGNGEITGGILVAVGSSGMAMNFRTASQGTALLTTSKTHGAGEQVELKDSQGKVLISYAPTSKFNSVVVSCPEMKEGGTYTLCVGSETQEFQLEQLVYGDSFGFGGGMRGPGGKGGFGDRPQQPGGEMGDPDRGREPGGKNRPGQMGESGEKRRPGQEKE